MHRSNIRVMKMDRNDRSILMRALYADFCANREVGLPYGHLAALITKLHKTRPGKLPLDDAEFRLARNSLNHLRNERIAAGGYTDAADAALRKLIRAKPPLWLFGRSNANSIGKPGRLSGLSLCLNPAPERKTS